MRKYYSLCYLLIFILFFISCEENNDSDSQLSLTEASEIVIDEIIQGDTISVVIYAIPEIIQKMDSIIVSNDSDRFYQFDFDTWFFFIDDAPPANWAHDCRYIFVNPKTSEHYLYEENYFPICYEDLIIVKSWPSDINPFWEG